MVDLVLGKIFKKKIIALIPAKSKSKRIPDKNIIDLNGYPLMTYTIESAKRSMIFESIYLITDSFDYVDIGKKYGIKTKLFLDLPDIGEYDSYLKLTIDDLKGDGEKFECFSILRPTNPFRNAETIKRAWQEFLENQPCNSLRAVELCKQHPGKMYYMAKANDTVLGREHCLKGFLNSIFPSFDLENKTPSRDMPYQRLPEIWVQNGSLEIAWVETLYKYRSFSGKHIYGFKTEGLEGFDINQPEDLILAKQLIKEGLAKLPEIN